MSRTSLIWMIVAIMLALLIFNRDSCHTNAYFDSLKMARFREIDALPSAFASYEKANPGKTPQTIDEAIVASPILFSPEAIERDSQTNRTLQRVVLFHDVVLDIRHLGKTMHPWIAAIYVPRETLPDIPGYRKNEDCIYWVGIQPRGPVQYQEVNDLVTCTDATKQLPPEIVAAAKARYDADVQAAATRHKD